VKASYVPFDSESNEVDSAGKRVADSRRRPVCRCAQVCNEAFSSAHADGAPVSAGEAGGADAAREYENGSIATAKGTRKTRARACAVLCDGEIWL